MESGFASRPAPRPSKRSASSPTRFAPKPSPVSPPPQACKAERTKPRVSEDEVIAGLRVLLKGGHASATALQDQFRIDRSLPHGHVAAVMGVLRSIGLHTALERKSGDQRALAMALIAGRILFPGSKLALSRHLSPATATSTLGEVDGLGAFRLMRWTLTNSSKPTNPSVRSSGPSVP